MEMEIGNYYCIAPLLGECVSHVGRARPDEAVVGVDQRVPHRQPQQRRVAGRNVLKLVL